MPSILSLDLPKPKNWQDFESIVLDALRLRWKSTTLQKNGRSGQAQQGVDIFGPDDIGRRAGIQCKRYAKALTMKVVKEEAANAEVFKPDLTTLYVATTSDHDAKFQQEVRLYSDKRVAAGKFAVSILFWEDIVGGLALNPAVFKLHYPTMQLPDAQIVDRDRLLAAVELGYYGPYLWEYIILTLGEFGMMANSDPENVSVLLGIVEQRTQQLLPPKDADAILSDLTEITKVISDSTMHSDENWAVVETRCKRISTRLIGLSSIQIKESNVLEVGRRLGSIFHHHGEAVPEKISMEVERYLCSILPMDSHATVTSSIANANANKYTYGYYWAPIIYTCLERELRFASFD